MADTAKAAYGRLKIHRFEAIRAAERAASLTLVTLVQSFRDDEHQTTRERLRAPYQMIGAEGVNSLSSKIALAWLPPNQSFVRLRVSEDVLATAESEDKTKIEEDLLKMEGVVMGEVESRRVRPGFHEGVKQLIVAGNVCLRLLPGKAMRVFPISSYVNVWDGEQNLIELIIEERLSWASLDQDLKDLLQANEPGEYKDDDKILLHTWIKRDGSKYKAHQEIGGVGTIIPGTETTYPLDALPYRPLRWTVNSDEPYGYGLVEEYQGAIESLEGVSQALTEGVGASVKVVFLVDPNGFTEPSDLTKTPNGGFCRGREEDVSALQLNKQADLAVAANLRSELTQSLSRIFLINSNVVRNAERVTAEEIRLLQLELDTALGGVFADLGQSFSLWLVRVVMKDLEKRGEIPKLKDSIEPTIITGIEALGRGHEVNRLAQALNLVTQLGIPLDQAGIKIPELVKTIFTGTGVETKEILQTEEEIQAQQQQQNTQQLIDSVGSAAIQADSRAQNGEQ